MPKLTKKELREIAREKILPKLDAYGTLWQFDKSADGKEYLPFKEQLAKGLEILEDKYGAIFSHMETNTEKVSKKGLAEPKSLLGLPIEHLPQGSFRLQAIFVYDKDVIEKIRKIIIEE